MINFQLKDAKVVTKIYIKDENDLNNLIDKLMNYRNRCEKYEELRDKINNLITDISPSNSIGEIAGKDSYEQNIAILSKYMSFDLKILTEIGDETKKLSVNSASKKDKKLFSQIKSTCEKIQKDKENEHYKALLDGGCVEPSTIILMICICCCASCMGYCFK